jgi:uncharacterized protein YkwD
MAVTGRHVYRTPVLRRAVIAVAVSCVAVFGLAVGCRSTIAGALFPAHDSVPAPAGIASAVTNASATGSASSAASAAITVAPSTAQPSGSPAPPAPQPGPLTDIAQALLAQINGWRATAGAAGLTMTSGLVASAHAHNLRMSAGCGMSHQCPGEAGLGSRISAEGIVWQAVAENVAWHSSVSSSEVLAAAQALNESMYNETPPNDGHRLNMLNGAYARIGIDVIRDANGQVWVTEDFAN